MTQPGAESLSADQVLEQVVPVVADGAAAADRGAALPAAALDAMRDRGLLSAVVSSPVNGGGLGLPMLVRTACRLARACGVTAMIWAMHQVQLACVSRHSEPDTPLSALLAETVKQQCLVASVTSGQGVGGDLRTSRCNLEVVDAVATLEKVAPVELEQLSTWNPLGMRGTCSPAFRLRASFDAAQVLPVPFAEIAESTMVPLSHLLWSAVWVGLAAEAFERGRECLRGRARGNPSDPPMDRRLATADQLLTGVEAQLADATARHGAVFGGRVAPTTRLLVTMNASSWRPPRPLSRLRNSPWRSAALLGTRTTAPTQLLASYATSTQRG